MSAAKPVNRGKRSARRGHPRWDHDRGRRSPRNTDTIKTNSQKNLLCDLAAANSGVPLHRKSLHSYYRISHVSIPTYHRTRESQTRSQTKTRRQQTDRPHTQGWRFAPDAILRGHRRARWWVPARTPRVHQCLHGGRPWVARQTPHATPQRHDQS